MPRTQVKFINNYWMHETEYDMKNYADRGGCYLPMPSSIKRSESNNCVTIRLKLFRTLLKRAYLDRCYLLLSVIYLFIGKFRI